MYFSLGAICQLSPKCILFVLKETKKPRIQTRKFYRMNVPLGNIFMTTFPSFPNSISKSTQKECYLSKNSLKTCNSRARTKKFQKRLGRGGGLNLKTAWNAGNHVGKTAWNVGNHVVRLSIQRSTAICWCGVYP